MRKVFLDLAAKRGEKKERITRGTMYNEKVHPSDEYTRRGFASLVGTPASPLPT